MKKILQYLFVTFFAAATLGTADCGNGNGNVPAQQDVDDSVGVFVGLGELGTLLQGTTDCNAVNSALAINNLGISCDNAPQGTAIISSGPTCTSNGTVLEAELEITGDNCLDSSIGATITGIFNITLSYDSDAVVN